MKSIILFIIWSWLATGFASPIQSHLAALARIKAGAGGGGPSLPTANLVMDLDPDSLALSDGASANGTWQDSSSGNNDMTLANGPTYETGADARNGHAAVKFDNTNDYGDSSFSLSRPYTIYVVEEAATNDLNRTVNSNSSNYLLANGRNSLVCVAGSVASPVTAYSGSTVIGCLVAPASGNATYFVDGADITSSAGTAVDWGLVTLGANGVFDEPANTNLYRILIYAEDHDSGERAATLAYLTTYYGL